METARESSELVADNVTKIFRDIEKGKDIVAIQNFSLTIKPNEFLAILGPSGCGKSTFLNIVAGFEKPSSGDVMLSGVPIKGPAADRGVVFQDFALFPWLTVEQNIDFGLPYRHLPHEKRKELIASLIRVVHLEGCENRYPRELSGGMKQRVALARVLATNPKILLMDEPFCSLDALTRYAMQQQLLEIWAKDQKTVLFITHSIDEALYLADRVVILSAGPGRILEVLEIKDERPRDLTSANFNRFRGQALRLLEKEVAKTAQLAS